MSRGKQFAQAVTRLLLAAAVTASCLWTPGDAYAASSSSSVIESVSVTFKTTFGEQEEIPEPEISSSGTGYSMGDVQYRTDYEKWKPGKKVRVEITLNADDGKYFPSSLNRSACKITGADFVSAKALDNTTLQVKADYKPVTVLGDTEKAGWSSDTGRRAVWKAVDYAPGYMVNLYGDNKIVKRLNVEANSVDLSSYMQDTDKTYYYEVKAIPLTSDQKKYLKEGNFVTSSDQVVDEEVIEQRNSSSTSAGDGGSLKGDSYVMPDGSTSRNTWKKLAGNWYYFNSEGNRSRGWTNVSGVWYYMDQNGVMLSGWVKDQGNWYYLGPVDDGAMRTGWIEPQPGKWYYLNGNGVMCTGWTNINGAWYYLGTGGDDGLMRTGWVQDQGVWYYLSPSGAMVVDTIVDGWTIGANGVASR